MNELTSSFGRVRPIGPAFIPESHCSCSPSASLLLHMVSHGSNGWAFQLARAIIAVGSEPLLSNKQRVANWFR